MADISHWGYALTVMSGLLSDLPTFEQTSLQAPITEVVGARAETASQKDPLSVLSGVLSHQQESD